MDTKLFDWLRLSGVHGGFCVLAQGSLVWACVRGSFLVRTVAF